mgnify:CR=1 FL=1
MAVLDILQYPDSRLHLKASKVEIIDDSIKQLVKDMTETIYYHEHALALAATQVNVQKRLFVADFGGGDEPNNLMVFINPEILVREGQIISEEGCLSVPYIYEKVSRSEKIKARYQDLDGVTHEIECSGLMAVCIQHEIDHLDGKVYIEYLSNLKQNFIKKKLKKIFKPK